VSENNVEPDAEEIVRAFLKAQKTAGRDCTWIDSADFICHSLYDFKLHSADGAVDGWNGDIVAEYMFEYFPEKITADKEMIARVPELITAFFGWMRTTGGIKPRTADAICKRVANNRRLFLREANNPQNFGISKSIVTAMLRAGVDPTNQREADRFLAEYNERVFGATRASTQPRPPASSPSDAPSKPPRTRWVRSGDEPAPDPAAPCPCGSGKRYKKCCKSR
jgi:hypothetical protein